MKDYVALSIMIAVICLVGWYAWPEPSQSPAGSGGSSTNSDDSLGVPVVVNDENFEEVVLQSDRPVLVDFWATWCGPCKQIAPMVKQLARDYNGRAVVAKLDVDVAGQTARKYGVRNIPTLIVFHHGKEVSRIVGAVDKSRLSAELDQALRN